MLDLKCDNCGNRTLQKQGSALVCSFCGSRYEIGEGENVTNKILTDAKLMSCYLEAEKYRQAEKFVEEFQELTKALEIDPNNAPTLAKMGRCCRELGQIDKALECYRKAIAIDPTFGAAYTNIGTIYILTEKYAEAVEIYEKGLPLIDKSQPDYWTAYANYALVIGKLGNLPKAASMIDEAAQHGYGNADGARRLLGLSVNRPNESFRSASVNAGGNSSSGKKSGCYVATCVYGSYNCPQVWTLRRFRDDTLAATWYGRAFIRTYYAVSPTLVKWFGKTKWFRRLWQKPLDRMVQRLNRSGVSDTPYQDKQW